jgi:hypothetical protein
MEYLIYVILIVYSILLLVGLFLQEMKNNQN